jgi:uncharacterized membrane protein YhaH (DUF805 family)
MNVDEASQPAYIPPKAPVYRPAPAPRGRRRNDEKASNTAKDGQAIMSALGFFLSFRGRISRSQYFAGGLLIVALWAGLFMRWSSLADSNLTSAKIQLHFFLYVVAPLLSYSAICLQIKRWHDLGKSGFWILINFVPYIGGSWALFETFFMSGDSGSNEYGDPPEGNDY